jgi:hypothetical protein
VLSNSNAKRPLNGQCCHLFLGPHTKKIFRRNQKNNSSEKKIPDHLENGQKLVEDVQKCKD